MGRESLSQAFPKFWDLFTREPWNETILRAVDWYLNVSSSAIHVGIVLAQAALESLSYEINHKKKKNESKADVLRGALEIQGIGCEIPTNCSFLNAVAKQEQWADGPVAITKIRNEIVHPKRRHAPISIEAQLDARNLGLHYID